MQLHFEKSQSAVKSAAVFAMVEQVKGTIALCTIILITFIEL